MNVLEKHFIAGRFLYELARQINNSSIRNFYVRTYLGTVGLAHKKHRGTEPSNMFIFKSSNHTLDTAGRTSQI